MFNTGINSEKFISKTFGSVGKSLGKVGVDFTLSTASFTLRNASLGSTSKLNLTSIEEYP